MSIYAVVETGSKQYRVEPNSIIDVEKLEFDEKKPITLDRVLLISDGKDVKVGEPLVKGASVVCELVEQMKAKKVISFKFRRRKDSRRKVGHRQRLTRLVVKEIKG